MNEKEIFSIKKHFGQHVTISKYRGKIMLDNQGTISTIAQSDVDTLVRSNHYIVAEDSTDLTSQVMDGMTDLERKGYNIGITEDRKGEVSGNPFHKVDKRAMSKAGMSEGMQDALSGGHEEGWLPSDDTPNRGLPSRHAPTPNPQGLPSQRR